jgi:hypothetical protein
MVEIRRHELKDGLADDLLGLIAEDASCGLVPAQNLSAKIFGEDRFDKGMDEGEKCRLVSLPAGSPTDGVSEPGNKAYLKGDLGITIKWRCTPITVRCKESSCSRPFRPTKGAQ